jgi:tRNA-specific 2-thiouridylase
MKVLVAMSGGVDSSVAAALMKQEGHDVIGITMKMWKGPNGEAPTAGCCTVSDAEDARRVAAQLDIPYYVLDYTDEFMGGVIDRFVDEYVDGRTPNPCVECNRSVKFTRLVEHASDLDCDVVVTGHYARTDFDGETWHLRRGVDLNKDQSYVLSMLGQGQLERIRFPVGGLTKPETRQLAIGLDLRTATKAESQDICFVGQGNYRQFLADQGIQTASGPIVDHDGTVLGEHDGITNFTVGQRKGLRVAVGEPRFVTSVDRETATVTLGRKGDLEVSQVTVTDAAWVHERPHGRVIVQYRAHGDVASAHIQFDYGGGLTVTFDEPQLAIAPGQTIAVYAPNEDRADEDRAYEDQGDEVLGGGIISTTA